jgi:hypothetical protein
MKGSQHRPGSNGCSSETCAFHSSAENASDEDFQHRLESNDCNFAPACARACASENLRLDIVLEECPKGLAFPAQQLSWPYAAPPEQTVSF